MAGKHFLECGKILTTFGVKGELKVQPFADEPAVLISLKRLYFDAGRTSVTVEAGFIQGPNVVLKLVGIDSPEHGRTLRGHMLYLDRDDIPLLPGEYFVQDLIGLKAVDADSGAEYGEIVNVTQTGANDVYHIKTDCGETLIPAIPDVVHSVDIDGGKVWVRTDVIKGIFE